MSNRDIDNHISEAASLFDFDQPEEDSFPSRKPDKPQLEVMLDDLVLMESMILQIQEYSFEHEKIQWTEDKLHSFFSPLHELWNPDDPQLCLSFKTYLSLSAHSSEATYDVI